MMLLHLLPSNVSTYALEYRLPLHNEDAFEAWSKPITGSFWAQNAKNTDIDGLGREIRESIPSPFRDAVVESHKSLNQHDGTSGLALEGITENSTTTTLTEKQKVLERGTITGKPAPTSPDFTTSQEVLSESVRDSEMGNIWSDAGQLGPNPVGTNQIDGMPLLDSPMRENFWYSFLDPLPIDVDFSSTQPL